MSTNANISKRRFKKAMPLLRTVLTLEHLGSNPYQNSPIRPAQSSKELEAFELAEKSCEAVINHKLVDGVDVEAYLKLLDCFEDLQQVMKSSADQVQHKVVLRQYSSGRFKGTVFAWEEAFQGHRDARRKMDKIVTTIQAHS